MEPFPKPEEQNTFRADSTIGWMRCSFEGRGILVTVAMLKKCALQVLVSMNSYQYATLMNWAQLSIFGRQIQIGLMF